MICVSVRLLQLETEEQCKAKAKTLWDPQSHIRDTLEWRAKTLGYLLIYGINKKLAEQNVSSSLFCTEIFVYLSNIY